MLQRREAMCTYVVYLDVYRVPITRELYLYVHAAATCTVQYKNIEISAKL